ncbi:MAG: hypothetical protein RLZ98_880 [Pseudomonadota bacterium]|jgi:hypothetical protein
MTFWGTIGRLFLVPFAFVIAAVATAFVAFTLGSERVIQMTHEFNDDARAVPELIAMMFNIGVLFTGLSLAPAVLLIIVGEVARIRSSLYYIIGGGVVLALIPVVSRMAAGYELQMPPAIVWQVLATAGFAGGFVYWMIAGRSA